MKLNQTGWLAIVAAGSLLTFGPSLHAAERKGKTEGGAGNRGVTMQERFDRIAEQLNLTDEQKDKAREAFRSQFEAMRGLRDASPDERREKLKTMTDEQDKKMKEILKPDQLEKWQTVKEQLRAQMQPGGAGGPGGTMQERFDRIAEQLNLTDEQKDKVKEAFSGQVETMRGLRDASPEERREKLKTMMDEQDKKMKEILKPDQFEKWQTVKEQLRSRMLQGGQGRRSGGV